MSSDLFALQSDIDLQDEAKRILDLPDAVLIETAWRFLAKLPARLDPSLGSRCGLRSAVPTGELRQRNGSPKRWPPAWP